MQLPRLGQQILSVAVAMTIALGSSFTSAVQIQLQQGLQFQSLTEQSQIDSSLIAAGSIVEIPDQYRVLDSNGRVNAELTLNHWLSTAGKTGVKEAGQAGGLLARAVDGTDYFYPVKIVSLAQGSSLKSYHGKTYFLALRILAQTTSKKASEGNQFSTTAPAHATSTVNSRFEGMSNCPDGSCYERSSTPSFDRLVADLGPVLRQAGARSTANRRRTGNDFTSMTTQFQRSCGFSLQSFVPVVKKYSQASGVPPEIMLSIMVQESSARCYETGRNENNTRDTGLFGVNSRTASRYSQCTANEIARMKTMSAASLENGPNCIANPVFNLRLALGILLAKVHDLTDLSADYGRSFAAFDKNQLVDSRGRMSTMAWRLAVSSYNGGEKWVFRAKSDLEAFNRVNGTHLSPYNWQDLRIFYLRRFLSENRERQYFGQHQEGRQLSAIANLGYTENVVPPAADDASPLSSLASLWSDYDKEH